MSTRPCYSAIFKRFADARSGSMLILSALAMPVIIGFAGLALEYGSAVALRAQNQRISDLAAYAGAVAYSHEASEARMRAAALEVVAINGGNPDHAIVSLVASPVDPAARAVRVDMTGKQPAFLSAILSGLLNIPVSAGATALIGSGDEGSGACILALDPAQSGITLSGGTRLNATECDIASNAAIKAPCGTAISAKKVAHAGKLDHCIWDNNVTETVVQQTTANPLADHAGIAAAWQHAANIRDSVRSPANSPDLYPTHWTYNEVRRDEQDISFGYNENQTKQQAIAAGCVASKQGSKWTLDCTKKWESDGWVQFRNVNAAGGIEVDFAPESTALIGKLHHSDWPRFKITGSIQVAANWNFGGGHWFIRQGLRLSGSATANFARGYFNIGSGAFNCSGAYSICNEGNTLTFGAQSEFHLHQGIHTAWGTTILGSGNGNSYHIGSPAGTGLAVSLGSGGRFRTGDVSGHAFFADKTNQARVFQLDGGVQSAGGSCVWFGDAAQHDVNGTMNFSGGARLGAGIWSINGSFILGANGGGNVNCFGQDISLSAQGVTLVITGNGAKSSGQCGTAIFCATAGYRNITLTAPDTGPTAGLAVIGPQNANIKNGALFTAGASSARISGAFYFPHGPLEMSGGAGIGGGAGTCFQVVASKVTLSGGTVAASNCVTDDTKGKNSNNVAVRIVR